jgi:hypothetical protein
MNFMLRGGVAGKRCEEAAMDFFLGKRKQARAVWGMNKRVSILRICLTVVLELGIYSYVMMLPVISDIRSVS